MAIKRLNITNFKSFKEMQIELGKFNVIIGANASGKSNFINIFRFLRDIGNFGLSYAIAMQGGIEYLRNNRIGALSNLSLKITSDKVSEYRIFGQENRIIKGKTLEKCYEFIIGFTGKEFEIIEDKLSFDSQFYETVEIENHEKEDKAIGTGKITISNIKGEVSYDFTAGEGLFLEKKDIFPDWMNAYLKDKKLPPDALLLQPPNRFMPYFSFTFLEAETFGDFCSEISIYDFDPKLPKKAVPITGTSELEEDGSNLAIVLNNIIEVGKDEKKLYNLISELLPFVEKIDVEKLVDKSFIFRLRESYNRKQYLPASLVSEGTINVTALIVALYFSKRNIAIIEEPEKNIHPFLISKVINMIKETSLTKQIIVTTHNPEIVKYTDKDNLLLISRDKEGFSVINRPIDKEEIREFLKNNIGIEELYIQNLLGM